jgi:hypothetical protein
MRTIKVSFDACDWWTFCKATDRTKADQALGYLAAWNQTFNHVHIYTRKDELVAVYRADPRDERASFVIGAIWHPDTETFSFHS